MNIRLWEMDNGDLINLEQIENMGGIVSHKDFHDYFFEIWFKSGSTKIIECKTEDETKLARFKLVERWNACLDMIHSQTWCPEAGTYSSSSKPIKEDKFEGYRERERFTDD